MTTDPRLEAALAGIFNGQPADDDDPRDWDRDYMTDNQADREYAEDADRAADRWEDSRDRTATQ